MIVRYYNHQDKADPMNGRAIVQDDELLQLLRERRDRRPFVAELSGSNGYEITFGLGARFCCAQYSRGDGSPPYLMAVSPYPTMRRGYIEFLAANTPTPFAARYIISADELKEIAVHFLRTGERSDAVSWQIFSPQAFKEDTAPQH